MKALHTPKNRCHVRKQTQRRTGASKGVWLVGTHNGVAAVGNRTTLLKQLNKINTGPSSPTTRCEVNEDKRTHHVSVQNSTIHSCSNWKQPKRPQMDDG